MRISRYFIISFGPSNEELGMWGWLLGCLRSIQRCRGTCQIYRTRSWNFHHDILTRWPSLVVHRDLCLRAPGVAISHITWIKCVFWVRVCHEWINRHRSSCFLTRKQEKTYRSYDKRSGNALLTSIYNQPRFIPTEKKRSNKIWGIQVHKQKHIHIHIHI